MARPKDGYKTAAGEIIPGTTTITGLMPKPALVGWAYKRGKEGLPLYDDADRAKAIGTASHHWFECRMRGETPDETVLALLDTDDREKVFATIRGFDEWYEGKQITVIEQEVPLVSERYKYGGTPDLIALFKDRLCLFDWKTSSAMFMEYLIQIAAYKNLWEENHPDQPITGGGHVLIAKKTGGFSHHWYGDVLEVAFQQFLLYRRVYDLDKQLKPYL